MALLRRIATQGIYRLPDGPSAGRRRPAVVLRTIHDRDDVTVLRADLVVYGEATDGASYLPTGSRVDGARFDDTDPLALGRWTWLESARAGD